MEEKSHLMLAASVENVDKPMVYIAVGYPAVQSASGYAYTTPSASAVSFVSKFFVYASQTNLV